MPNGEREVGRECYKRRQDEQETKPGAPLLAGANDARTPSRALATVGPLDGHAVERGRVGL
jgi:hypothetical protein